MIDKKIISKRSKDCGMIRKSKKAKKERQAEKLKKLKKWGNMKKKTPSADTTGAARPNFRAEEYGISDRAR